MAHNNPFVPNMKQNRNDFAIPMPEVTYRDTPSGSLESKAFEMDNAPSYDPYYSGPDTKEKEEEEAEAGRIRRCQLSILKFFQNNSGSVIRYIGLILLILYTIYFGFAVAHSVDGATALIVLTCLVILLVTYEFVKKHWGRTINKRCLKPFGKLVDKIWPWLQWVILPVLIILVICSLALELIREIKQLQSLVGMIVFILYLVVTSKHPSKINIRPVAWGFGLQFVLGILVLRWIHGYNAIKWLSEQIITFINFSLEGAAVVFGNPMLLLHPLVFVAMPMLIYVGAVMAILYYIGFTQAVASRIGWAMQATMGCTAIESLAVGAGIFLNGLDTVLMVRQYIPRLTKSEFHCFLIGNHATVAGFAFPLFVMFGAPPQYLLSASVMSAPATIAVAKINYPETEKSMTKRSKDLHMQDGQEDNIMEAASQGAAMAGKTVGAFVANYIAFVGLIAFLNAFLSWIGGMVGYPELSFDVICSYLFFPIAMLLGVDIPECREVAKLLGIKVFTSEILAYQELGRSVANGLSDRAASIATYALCGFCSVSTVSVAVGVWNAIVPERAALMASQLFRVTINANISCFLTACIAGIMHNPDLNIRVGENETGSVISAILGILPDYKDIMNLVPGFNFG